MRSRRRAASHLTARAVHRLQAHAGGNPLYSGALLDELPADAWHRQDNLPAPRSFAAIVKRRAAACSPDAARLLEGVAILGPHGQLATAAELADVEAPLDALEEAAPPGCCASTIRAACPRPRSRTR